MSTRITIAPVTRIEGHLDVHLDVDGSGTIEQAHASGTLFRGFENIMQGRDPRDAIHLTQRVCGVCPVPHARASVEAVEQAFGVTVSKNALLLRNLVQGATCISDHILHFYHLAILDYIRGPAIPPFTPASSADLRFSPAEEQELAKHYLQALDMRREWQELAGIFAGKVPHVATFAAGGVTQVPTAAKVEAFSRRLDALVPFIENVYLPDAKRLAEVYPEYLQIGAGPANLLSFGSFPDGGRQLFPAGKWTRGQTAALSDGDIASIKESIKHSHYEPDKAKRGLAGETTPSLDKRGAYSWIKSPRLQGEVFQVGTLPRMIIAGHYKGGLSVMDRLLSAAHESAVIASAMKGWVAGLQLDASGYQPVTTMPRAGKGFSLTEATRGSLAHWLEYADGKVTGYRIITPTSWNGSPRDDRDVPGPIEQALRGVKIADRSQPVEAYRVIHSFDPCLGCAVH